MTVSHGHLAFFGAYALLNLTFFYFAIPRLRGSRAGGSTSAPGSFGFW